jgi:hypothetical protein
MTTKSVAISVSRVSWTEAEFESAYRNVQMQRGIVTAAERNALGISPTPVADRTEIVFEKAA